MAIIGISGKIGSGKDTVGSIIQILTNFPHFTDEAVERWIHREVPSANFTIKKYADKLKDIVCLLIGCTREQLEDHEFKNKELGRDWRRYYIINRDEPSNRFFRDIYGDFNTEKEVQEYITKHNLNNLMYTYESLTPRLLLQLIGTECGRNILHPNIWVNSLMAEYKVSKTKTITKYGEAVPYLNSFIIPVHYPNHLVGKIVASKDFQWEEPVEGYPNWIITDMRFPNELQAIKDRNGISIKVERTKEPLYLYNGDTLNLKDLFSRIHAETGEYPLKEYADDTWLIKETKHESETALDTATFDYVIVNDGSLQDLIRKVKEILIKENLYNEKN